MNISLAPSDVGFGIGQLRGATQFHRRMFQTLRISKAVRTGIFGRASILKTGIPVLGFNAQILNGMGNQMTCFRLT